MQCVYCSSASVVHCYTLAHYTHTHTHTHSHAKCMVMLDASCELHSIHQWECGGWLMQRIEMTLVAASGAAFDEVHGKIGKWYVHFRQLLPPIFPQLIRTSFAQQQHQLQSLYIVHVHRVPVFSLQFYMYRSQWACVHVRVFEWESVSVSVLSNHLGISTSCRKRTALHWYDDIHRALDMDGSYRAFCASNFPNEI